VELGGYLQEHQRLVGKVGYALSELGGVAIRMEASGAASAWEPWLSAFAEGDLAAVYARSVLLVGDEAETFTCGMHQFGLPDAQIAIDDRSDAARWLDTLCAYQVEERPVLLSGHTFRPDADSERRVLERWPDPHHDSRDGRHNPFGQWRIQREAEARLRAAAVVPVIIPSLVAQLMAAEREKGRPLSQREVEALTANATAMTMHPEAAIALERSRGYADIEPELAWEQWQIVRGVSV
jgi:Domain of unknown function (DUF4261)